MKIPNLPSRYHSGMGTVFSDSHSGPVGARARDAVGLGEQLATDAGEVVGESGGGEEQETAGGGEPAGEEHGNPPCVRLLPLVTGSEPRKKKALPFTSVTRTREGG